MHRHDSMYLCMYDGLRAKTGPGALGIKQRLRHGEREQKQVKNANVAAGHSITYEEIVNGGNSIRRDGMWQRSDGGGSAVR